MAADDDLTSSLNRAVMVLPAPGPVTIDGKDNDWDLSAGVWSYNDPVIVDSYSVWTHLMWDEDGVYMLARYHDKTPMENATRGKDFAQSWMADAYQARVILDDKTPDEHQMHINLFYSTPEQQPYLIVKHGGFKAKPPYDQTGPDRPDLNERFGPDMLEKGGKIAFRPWEDGKGYNMEAFWPWSYLRLNGQPLKPGDEFVFGIEAMWGNSNGTKLTHRLADGVKDIKVNRIFMFRAREGWGRAIISDRGHQQIAGAQRELQAARLKRFVNYDTVGSIPIAYDLPDARDVTIAIDNARGERVRNLIGQYPRAAGKITDHWDGLDDDGKPVAPGSYTATVLDHKPIELTFFNSLYNAAIPPWTTDTGMRTWGSNHGYPSSVATRGDVIVLGFMTNEGASGIMRVDSNGKILWADWNDFMDVTLDDQFAYGISRNYWQKQTLLLRLRLSDGRVMPFENADKSPAITILPTDKDIPATASIACADGKLFIHIPRTQSFRVEPRTGQIEAQWNDPALVAFAAHQDELIGLSVDGTIAQYGADGKPARILTKVAGLEHPVRFAVRQDGQRFAISNDGTNQVLVFDADGKQVSAIGNPRPGDERPAGKFVVTDLSNPLGLGYDAQGRLWVTEADKASKRVTCWSDQGELVDQFWGAADYGAMGGFPIPADSTRFIAHAVEFKLDPAPDVMHRKTGEQPLIYHPALKEQRGFVYTVNGRDYACTTPGYNRSEAIIIAKRNDQGVFAPCVRMELATRKHIKGKWEIIPGRAWIDLNDNGVEDAGEITEGVQARAVYWSNGWIRPNLTILTQNSLVYPVKSFTSGGVPIYDFANPTEPPNALPFGADTYKDSTLVMDRAGNISAGLRWHMVDGRKGRYPNRYDRHNAPAAQRGVLIAPFRTNGVVEDVPGVGSITAISGDRGEWFLMSMDGFYISSILQDIKGETTADATFVGAESFGGFIWRDAEDRVLVQLGGASYRLMEVHGLETIRKHQVALNITNKQIEEGQHLAATARGRTLLEPDELTIARLSRLPTQAIASSLSLDQPLIEGATDVRVQEEGNPSRHFRAALAHDGKNLAVAYQVSDNSPWKNGEGQFTHAFIGGDSVDLKLDVPGRGPVRLLVAPVEGRNTAIYFQKKSDKPDNPTTYVVANNPTNAEKIDVVRRLGSARIAQSSGMDGYTVLVTVPLADLGLEKATELSGVIGVIFSDPTGTNRASRLYWHDKNTGLVSDVPSEARIDPTRFGKIVIGQ